MCVKSWLGHWPGNRKVSGSIHGNTTSVVSLSKKLHSHCSSLPSCLNGDLVAWCQLGEAAHPAVGI